MLAFGLPWFGDPRSFCEPSSWRPESLSDEPYAVMATAAVAWGSTSNAASSSFTDEKLAMASSSPNFALTSVFVPAHTTRNNTTRSTIDDT